MVRQRSPRGGVLLVASGGGHWEQLMRLADALAPYSPLFATTDGALLARWGIEGGEVLPDCNRDEPGASARSLAKAFALVARLRPRVVITTGAAPGLFCLIAGRAFGAHTVWIDSLANAEELSGSGRLARWVAKDWLTQWEHLATPGGPRYEGAVL